MQWRPIETAPRTGFFYAYRPRTESAIKVRFEHDMFGQITVCEPESGKIFSPHWWLPMDALPPIPDPEKCEHEFVEAVNKIIKGYMICTKCKCLKKKGKDND